MNEHSKANNAKSTQSVRRQFIKRASAAVVISAVPAKTVWATGGNGCSVSGNLSGSLSRPCEEDGLLSGRSPGYWDKVFNLKPNGQPHVFYRTEPLSYDPETLWKDVFVDRPPFGTKSETQRLGDFLPNAAGGGGNALDRHLVAAYLNAAVGYYPLDGVSAEEYVIGLYDLVDNGTYTMFEMEVAIDNTY